MDEMLTDFLILGQIPGTSLRIEFGHILGIIVFCGVILLGIVTRLVISSSLRLIDPYRNAPKDLREVDLIAL